MPTGSKDDRLAIPVRRRLHNAVGDVQITSRTDLTVGIQSRHAQIEHRLLHECLSVGQRFKRRLRWRAAGRYLETGGGS